MSILNPLYYAVAWVLQQIHTGLTLIGLPAAGGLTWLLTIVILVVLLRLLLVPLFIKQMHATRKMSALAPQLQELRKKYKNDRETLNQETMRLYRENGANPLAGCLPLVAQLPVWFALFNVLRAIADWKPGTTPLYGLTTATVTSAKNATILGAHLSDKVLFTAAGQNVALSSKIVILCFVLISVVTTFMTVRQSTKRGMTPQMTPGSPMASSQKMMQYIVPVFALTGLYWQFGLVLYWVTTNVWTLGQQYVLFKRYPMPVPAGAAAAGSAGPVITPGKAEKPGEAGKETKAGGSAAGTRRQGAGTGKTPGTGKAQGTGTGKTPGTGKAQGTGTAAANGTAASVNGSSLMRRFSRNRPEPEPQEQAPDVKLVRQQRVRQSRSKRSGKR